MIKHFWIFLLSTSLLGAASGGSMLYYHLGSVSSFDSQISGSPMVVGGFGCFEIGEFCLGVGGGGAVLTGASGNPSFGMALGGALVEYNFMPWLFFRAMVGGGAYRIEKLVNETPTERVLYKLGSGGFAFLEPTVNVKLQLQQWLNIVISTGYFMTSVSKLNSFAMGINLLFG